jgi:hypothetical protein
MISDAIDLQPFEVIRLPYTYLGEQPERKRFVFICNEASHAICLKTTSNTVLYKNDPALMAGVVFYAEGTSNLFERDTAIQPDNPHPIAHQDILNSIKRQTFEQLGVLPTDFRDKLIAAIGASKTMKPERKRNLLKRL